MVRRSVPLRLTEHSRFPKPTSQKPHLSRSATAVSWLFAGKRSPNRLVVHAVDGPDLRGRSVAAHYGDARGVDTEAGLLSSEAMQEMLREHLRQRAGETLREMWSRMHNEVLTPEIEQEVADFVRAHRVEQRSRRVG